MTGEVRAHDGTVSNQWDVLICDAPNTPRLYEQGGSSVVPIETVRGAISVKSTLNRAAVEEAVHATEVLRAMPRRQIPVNGLALTTAEPSPAVFLFGFEGNSLESLKDAATGAASAAPLGALNGICLHTHGMVVPLDPQGPTPCLSAASSLGTVETGEGSYGVFVAMLYAALQAQPMHAPDLVAYIDLGRIAGHTPE